MRRRAYYKTIFVAAMFVAAMVFLHYGGVFAAEFSPAQIAELQSIQTQINAIAAQIKVIGLHGQNVQSAFVPRGSVATPSAFSRQSKHRIFLVQGAKAEFGFGEEPEFSLQLYDRSVVSKPEDIRVTLNHSYATGRSDARAEVSQNPDGTFQIRLTHGHRFTPGLYRITIEAGGDTTTEDVTWGVLAVNFNKATYQIGDRSHLMFGFLDSGGVSICGAEMSATITAPNGTVTHFSTDDGTITAASTCSDTSVNIPPDYEAYYRTQGAGTYQVSVIAKNPSNYPIGDSVHKISDSFSVDPSAPFDLERIGPTRTYPPNHYQFSLNIVSKKAWQGDAVERLPDIFDADEISDGGTVITVGDEKQIIWHLSLGRGEAITLQYRFIGPDVSPQLFFLGPAQFINGAPSDAFEEARPWQIASDAIHNIQCYWTGTTNTDWNTSTNWNCSAIPSNTCSGNGNCYWVGINSGTNPPVLNTTARTVSGLTIGTSTAASLTINGAVGLTVENAGTAPTSAFTVGTVLVSSNGTLNLNPTSAIPCLTLNFTGSGQNIVSGGGTITSSNSNCTLVATSNTSFSNSGTMSGSWSMQISGFSNSGTLNMTGGEASTTANTPTITCGNATITSNKFYNFTSGVATTFAGSGGGCDFGNLLKANAGTMTFNTNASTTDFTVNSGQTVTLTKQLGVAGNFTNSGTFTPNGERVYLTGSSKNITFGGGTIHNLEVSGSYTTATNNGTTSALIIDSGASLTVGSTQFLTATSTVTLNGTLTRASLGNGTTTFGSSGFACSNVPSAGTLSANVRFDATAGNCTIPARAYGGNIEAYSNSSSAGRSVLWSTGSSTAVSNLFVNANNTQNITFDGATNNPSPVHIGGDIDFVGTGSGSEIIQTGTGNWVVSGNANFTGGTLTAASANWLTMNGTSKTLTIAGAGNLVNFSASSSITISGNATTTGNFLIDSAGTLTAPGSTASLYINGNFNNGYGGTFTHNNGTVFFNGSSAQTISGATSTSAFNNVILSGTGGVSFASGNNGSTSALTINSGETLTAPSQMTISGNYTNSGTQSGSPATLYFNGSSAQTLIGATTTAFAGANWILNGTGGVSFASGNNASTTNLTINSGETLTAPSLLTVSGNYTNSGTFTANGGTVYASSSAPQTFSGTMTGSTGAFNNLTILNNSGTNPDTNPAIIFANKASTTATFSATLASTTIRFPASATSTFVNFTINGQAANSRVWFRSSTAGTPWGLIVTGTQSVSYADVQDSYACDGSTITASNGTNNNSGNNSCWTFAASSVATVTSAANQVFAVSQASTPISQLTITNVSGSAITAANGLRIAIATSTVNMLWDPAFTKAVFGGSASTTRVASAIVGYEGGNSVATITVASDFANGEQLTVSGLNFANFGAAVASSTAIQLFLDGINDQSANAQNTAQYVAITGAQTVANATAGQESNKLANAQPDTTVSNAALFSFRLTPSSESASTTQIVVNLSSVSGYACSNIANLNLYVDYNSNNSVDAGETATGTAACSISGSTGTFTFTTKLATSTARDFVVQADVSGNNFGNTMTLGLSAANVTTRGQTSNQPITVTGTVTNATHSQQSTSGGGASAAGSVSPSEVPTFGATTQSGGGATEGGQGGTVNGTGGATNQGGGSPVDLAPLFKPFAGIQLPWNFASALFGFGRFFGL